MRHSLRPACCSSSANLSVVQSANPRPTTWTPIGNGLSSLDVSIATGQTVDGRREREMLLNQKLTVVHAKPSQIDVESQFRREEDRTWV